MLAPHVQQAAAATFGTAFTSASRHLLKRSRLQHAVAAAGVLSLDSCCVCECCASATECGTAPPKTKRRCTRTLAPPSVCIGRGAITTRAKTRARPATRGLSALILGGDGGDGDNWGGGRGGGGGGDDCGAEDAFNGPYYESLWLWRLVCVVCMGHTLGRSVLLTPLDEPKARASRA